MSACPIVAGMDQCAVPVSDQVRRFIFEKRPVRGHWVRLEGAWRELPQEPKLAANWVMGELAAALNKENLEIGSGKLPPARLAGLLKRICDQTISGKIAKEVFETMWSGGASADALIDAQGLRQITDTAAIERVIDEVMTRNPAQLAEYRAGKDKLFGFFVGQVMKATGGKANPAQLNELLRRKLGG